MAAEIWASKMEPVPKLNDYADFGVHSWTPDGPTVKSVVEQSVAWTAGLRKAMSCRRHTPVKTIGEMGATIDEMFNKGARPRRCCSSARS